MAAPLGNQNAKKAKVWTEAIKRALARLSAENGDELPSVDKGLDRLADRMVRAATHGDESAFHLIAEKIGDRLEGKAAQSLTVSGDDEAPLTIKGFIDLVKPGG